MNTFLHDWSVMDIKEFVDTMPVGNPILTVPNITSEEAYFYCINMPCEKVGIDLVAG